MEKVKNFILCFVFKIKTLILFVWDKMIVFSTWSGKKHPEIYTVPLAFLVFWFSEILIRELDPTSGIFDGGVLQIPLFSILLLFLFLAVSWMAMGILFSTAKTFLKAELKANFNNLTTWQKVQYSTGVLFFLLLCLVLLSFVLGRN